MLQHHCVDVPTCISCKMFAPSIFLQLYDLPVSFSKRQPLYTLRSVVFYKIKFSNEPAGWRRIKGIAIGTEGLGCDFLAGQIGLIVASGSPSVRRFFGGAVLPRGNIAEIGPATRYTLRRNIANLIKT